MDVLQRLTGWRVPPIEWGEDRPWPTRAELEAAAPEERKVVLDVSELWRWWVEHGWPRWAEHRREHLGTVRRAEALRALVGLGYVAAGALAGGGPGKRALGVRVVDSRGGPPRLRQALVRDGVRPAARLLLVALAQRPRAVLAAASAGHLLDLADGIWPLVDRRRRALRDLLAGTRVVRDRRR